MGAFRIGEDVTLERRLHLAGGVGDSESGHWDYCEFSIHEAGKIDPRRVRTLSICALRGGLTTRRRLPACPTMSCASASDIWDRSECRAALPGCAGSALRTPDTAFPLCRKRDAAFESCRGGRLNLHNRRPRSRWFPCPRKTPPYPPDPTH